MNKPTFNEAYKALLSRSKEMKGMSSLLTWQMRAYRSQYVMLHALRHLPMDRLETMGAIPLISLLITLDILTLHVPATILKNKGKDPKRLVQNLMASLNKY